MRSHIGIRRDCPPPPFESSRNERHTWPPLQGAADLTQHINFLGMNGRTQAATPPTQARGDNSRRWCRVSGAPSLAASRGLHAARPLNYALRFFSNEPLLRLNSRPSTYTKYTKHIYFRLRVSPQIVRHWNQKIAMI